MLIGTAVSAGRLDGSDGNLYPGRVAEQFSSDTDVFIETFRLSSLFEQIVLTAKIDADKRKQTLSCEVDWQIEIEADRQFILSAVANLVQNAIKYTKSGGKIRLRAKVAADRVLIEIEDQCGGIESETLSSIFKPYAKGHNDRSGLGLGLTITRRAVHLSAGTIEVRNNPGHGCTFVINIPKKLIAGVSSKSAVPGIDSVQPDFPSQK